MQFPNRRIRAEVRSFDFGANTKQPVVPIAPTKFVEQRKKILMKVEPRKESQATRDSSIVEVHAAKNGKGLKEVSKMKGKGLSPKQRSQLENNVPKLLRDACGWVCWKFGSSNNSHKVKKIPIDPQIGGRADVNDITVGGTLREAIEACRRFGADGVGYAIVPIDHFAGVDLDNCRDAATGKITTWAEEVIRDLNSYTEVTPSGRGVHVWVEGKWPYSNNRKSGLGEKKDEGIEVYSHSRFFTVTGHHVEGTPTVINRNQAALDKMYKLFWKIDSSKRSSPSTGARAQVTEDDATLLKKAFAAQNGKKFKQLWDGEWQTADYKSQSEADMALAGHLAFWTNGDAERMDNLFRQSGLYRPKWDEKHHSNGETYGEHTIGVAIGNKEAGYGNDFAKSSPHLLAGSVCIADVQSRPVQWLWRGWIPKGKVTLIEGDPGLAKSLLTLDLAARITKGKPMPDGSSSQPGTVILTNAEDGLDDTVRPRLEAAGADLNRCIWLDYSAANGQQTLIIPDRINILSSEIEKSNAVLVVIDPFVSYLGKQINSWNDQDVRRAMASLSQLAEQTGAAIVLIRHPNKREDVKNRLYRGGGSIGIIAAARSALLVMPDSRDPNLRVLSTTKCNLAAPPNPLQFEVESVEYAGSDEGIPHILWRGQQSQPTVRSVSSTARQKLSPIDDAKEFANPWKKEHKKLTKSFVMPKLQKSP